ncbi:Patatin [Gloeothece citriformis PCC 7424]|uniref:Patatin n=1 Tax=Gloeothece citriformis (strain PCC 7424) TaxID=65393 RepID=B7KBN2_GLOC7|nr:CBASS cGAMP-activated phospholipase [Gloeothece citriformis]ACK73010.1 Patatin [Gloeothece citriformis PCC 7424]
MSELIKILSVDGGGIRGIIPALILLEIENLTQKPISELFDLIAGTSTGGLIALSLTAPDEQGNPRYSAQDVINLYEEEGERIFSRSLLKTIQSVRGIIDERYSSEGVEDVLERYLQDTRLKEALTDVFITSYELEKRFPFFFSSRDARNQLNYDFPMKQVAMATSAAPTYFEPVRIETNNPGEYYVLIDGGVYANNPALCAFMEAQTIYGKERDFLVVSLGTGEYTEPILYEQARNWGKSEWLPPLLNVVFDGVSDTVNFHLQNILSEDCYYRFQPILTPENEAIDNTRPENLNALKELAQNLIRNQSSQLQQLTEKLLQ